MSLRVVTDSDTPSDMSMAERIERMMRECQAANPNAVLLVWEADADLSMRCAPAVPAVAIGMVQLAKQLLRGDL